MVRRCARPACNAPAAVTFTFDGLHRILWLAPLAEAAAYSAGNLCSHHADNLKPPRNWEVRDHRRRASRAVTATGATAPSRHLAPEPAAPPLTLPLEPARSASARSTPAASERRTDRRRPAVPAIPRAGAAPRLEARTPLLQRAFRAANVG